MSSLNRISYFAKNLITNLLVLVFFLLISLFIFKDIILAPGIITSSDWALPYTSSQLSVGFQNSFLTWVDQGLLFGARQSIFTPIPYQLIVRLITILGINGGLFSRLWVIGLQVLAGFTLYQLLVYFKLKKLVSMFGGLVYMTTPAFFNYSIMGWTFVLLFMGILPLMVLCLCKAVRENNIKCAIVLGILYAFSIIQSQAIVWWPIVAMAFGVFLVKDKPSLINFVKTMIISGLIFFLLNFYWISGLLAVDDTNISGSDIVTSSVSLGTMGHFRPANIVRLFGSLFNFQYELAINYSPTLGQSPTSLWSFVLPLIVFASLFLNNRRRLIYALWLLAIFPAVMYYANYFRSLLLYLPFANVLRDFARFTIVSSFAYPILASLVVNSLWITKKLRMLKKLLAILMIILWAVSVYPWWTGEISAWDHRTLGDMRMRVKQFPADYLELEEKFAKEITPANALYFPTSTILDFLDDEKFHGTFSELIDVFAAYSPVPGSIYVSDRDNGYIGQYLKLLFTLSNPDFSSKFFDALRLTNIKFIVIKKNVVIPNIDIVLENLRALEKSGKASKYFESTNIVVFELTHYYPRVYIPSTIYVTNQSLSNLPYLSEDMIVFTHQNTNFQPPDKITSPNQDAWLEFKKINSTKYRVIIHQAKGKIPIVLNQTFHDHWKVYLPPFGLTNYLESVPFNKPDRSVWNNSLSSGSLLETWDLRQLTTESHLMVNGWANAWIIDTNKLCQTPGLCQANSDQTQDLELIIEFFPQRYFYLGCLVSLFTLALSLVAILFLKDQREV
ncbi:MAG: hypothetical protein ABIJ33_04510 [Patescibacteria group bacterium]